MIQLQSSYKVLIFVIYIVYVSGVIKIDVTNDINIDECSILNDCDDVSQCFTCRIIYSSINIFIRESINDADNNKDINQSKSEILEYIIYDKIENTTIDSFIMIINTTFDIDKMIYELIIVYNGTMMNSSMVFANTIIEKNIFDNYLSINDSDDDNRITKSKSSVESDFHREVTNNLLITSKEECYESLWRAKFIDIAENNIKYIDDSVYDESMNIISTVKYITYYEMEDLVFVDHDNLIKCLLMQDSD